MAEREIKAGGMRIPVDCLNTLVVGSGAAGLAAAVNLHKMGVRDTAVITENLKWGTSRNTGSDKQTYYKLSLSGEEGDSVGAVALSLYQGKAMDGEHALIEAALSAPCFLELASLGVPFPTNRYGEYIGYQTDHDSRKRGSSVGPLTSKKMTEVLEEEVLRRDIPVYENQLAIRLLKEENRVKGILCLDLKKTAEKAPAYHVFLAHQVILATGGPAGIYWDSVYPRCHHGMSGMAFWAGVRGKNLTEWQYGLASKKPRWNVSGTYMQALPGMISTTWDGKDEREFLTDYLGGLPEVLHQTFLKGYQWPFDVRKLEGGSSRIDLAVYEETVKKGRRVFLDYRENPGGGELQAEMLKEESRRYLEKAGALFGTPYERLKHMNRPAVEFYKSKGVDLKTELLEISLCAQHNNGGLAVDLWWQTNVEGLFAAGEAAGTHGVYRPGGTALNAGQAGARRAALYICEKGRKGIPEEMDEVLKEQIIEETRRFHGEGRERKSLRELTERVQKRMSAIAGPVRKPEEIRKYLKEVEELLGDAENWKAEEKRDYRDGFLLRDILMSQKVYLTAMLDYTEKGMGSRGSALYVREGRTADMESGDLIQECELLPDGEVRCFWREANPIPKEDNFFENVWRGYRENKNIY